MSTSMAATPEELDKHTVRWWNFECVCQKCGHFWISTVPDRLFSATLHCPICLSAAEEPLPEV